MSLAHQFSKNQNTVYPYISVFTSQRFFSTSLSLCSSSSSTSTSTSTTPSSSPPSPSSEPSDYLSLSIKLSKSKSPEDRIIAHRLKLSHLRKTYYKAHQEKLAKQKEEEEKKKKNQTSKFPEGLGDPLKVGTLASRRAIKTAMIRQFGQIDPTPLTPTQFQPSKYERIPPPIQLSSWDSKPLLHSSYKKDLTSSNPRLLHLLHLWHSTESFVTKDNLESKLTAFFHQRHAPEFEVCYESKRTLLESFHFPSPSESSNSSDPSSLDPEEFATQELEFKLPQGDLPHVEMGSPYDHAMLREIILKDKVTGSLYGKPGLKKIFEWGATDPKSNTKPKRTY